MSSGQQGSVGELNRVKNLTISETGKIAWRWHIGWNSGEKRCWIYRVDWAFKKGDEKAEDALKREIVRTSGGTTTTMNETLNKSRLDKLNKALEKELKEGREGKCQDRGKAVTERVKGLKKEDTKGGTNKGLFDALGLFISGVNEKGESCAKPNEKCVHLLLAKLKIN